MSRLITIDSLTKLRKTFREQTVEASIDDIFLHLEFNSWDIRYIEAADYPEPSSHLISNFNSAFELDPKNEFELARILYEGIRLNKSQAANNQYWVYLNLKYFNDYIESRWLKLNEEDPTEYSFSQIDKFFLALEPSQNSLIKSPIAGLWWAVELTIDHDCLDPYHYTKIFLSERNLRTKTMGTYQLIRHKNIIQAMLDFFDQHKNSLYNGQRIGSEAVAQMLSKTINQIGGITLLSYLTKEEIMAKLTEHKELILQRAKNVQLGKVVSREKIQEEKRFIIDENVNQRVVKFLNISNSGEYCLKDNENTELYEFSAPIYESHKDGYMLFCYNEDGKINRVDIASILQKTRDKYMNGVFKGNTINSIISLIDENDIIGILIERGNEKFFKGYLVSKFKANNSNIGLNGYKTLYDKYDSVSYFRIPSTFYNDIKRVLPTSLTTKCKSVSNSYYKNEWNVLRKLYPKYF